jgi:hypothetical protein
VSWRGGARNRLYDVRRSERTVLPEIPCSFRAEWAGLAQYRACVATALDELVVRCSIWERARFLSSALRAFSERQ